MNKLMLMAMLSFACKDEEPMDDAGLPDTGRPDSGTPDTGSTDTGNTDTGEPVDPGALVVVSISSTVGVLLDELSPALADRVAADVMARPSSWWIDRAKQQLRMTAVRLIYRDFFFDPTEGRLSLPLPPEEVWDITLDSAGPQRATVEGHDLVLVEFTMDSTLLTDVESPARSEPELATIGGYWEEEFVLPIDPTLILQRTGYACMDEDQFPPESVDAENAYQFYDDTCEIELLGDQVCHLTEPLPTEHCIDAVSRAIGRVETAVAYERIAWDAALAGQVRVGEVTSPDAPDLKVLTEGFQSLSNNRVIYKYFPSDHCALVEQCIGGSGWRRLLAFDSIDHNIGGQPIHIGEVDYFVEGFGSELIDHNVYELSECHEHYHFQHYGDFAFGTGASAQIQKNGFCLESTGRLSNNEMTPLHTPYRCHLQGVSAGWVDLYAAGLTCNWVDITDVDTSGGPVTDSLTFRSNPDGFICEGTLQLDGNGDQIWEPTTFTSSAGDPVDRPACDEASGTEANDIGIVSVTVPQQGGMVTSPCADSQILGPLRNCGFTSGALETCNQGVQVTLQCTGGDAAQAQVIRICEGSATLGLVDCTYQDALAQGVIEAATASISFTCPAARNGVETGGRWAVYTAPVFTADGSRSITCQ